LSNIRVTYSGLISFIAVFSSIITGTIFTVIVTRRLDPTDFALWSVIGSLFVLIMIFDPIASYWTNRQVARDQKVAVTAFGSNSLFSIFGVVIYLGLSTFMALTSDANFEILLFGSLMIPFVYINKILKTITGASKPQGNGYALVISEITKIPVGFLLVYFLDMGIIGAITTTLIASSAQLLFYFYYINEKLHETFSLNIFKTWIKRSWLSLYSGNTDRFSQIDVAIYSAFFGSISGLAYLGIGKTMGNLVSMSTYLSTGLFPKLIATKKANFIELSLKRTLFLSVLMLSLVIVFVKPGLWILNPVYIDGVNIVIIWSLAQFSLVFLNIFSGSLTGLETIDTKSNVKFKELLKSKLFFVPTIDHIFRIIYLGLLICFFTISIFGEFSTITIISLWGIALLITNTGISIVYWNKLKNLIPFKFPLAVLMKYLISAIVSSLPTAYLLNQFVQYDNTIFDFIPQLIPLSILQVGIYLLISCILDVETKKFILSIINEIRN
jgi:hypothetical protein